MACGDGKTVIERTKDYTYISVLEKEKGNGESSINRYSELCVQECSNV